MSTNREKIIEFLKSCDRLSPVFENMNGSKIKTLDLTTADPFYANLKEYNSEAIGNYLFSSLEKEGYEFGIGGFGEDRSWYEIRGQFLDQAEPRVIHLGVDIWVKAGTKLYAPLEGKVHSFKFNNAPGDYGPTLVIEHLTDSGIPFYSLYGHLSLESIKDKSVGMEIVSGQEIGAIGAPPINGDWAPHLHIQLIVDMDGKQGDFVGLCAKSMKEHYVSKICIDPAFILKFL